MRNYCGIILVKKYSERLKNKNFLDLNDKPVYTYSLDALFGICDTFIFSDHEAWNDANRPPAASLPDEPIFSALKWAYKSLPKRYDAIINIMANCPQLTSEGVKKAIERFEALGCDELRSFNKDGTESGLIIVKEKYLLEKFQISTYQAAIELESIEIHTQEDFDRVKQIMK
jgi:molybdopterin-guanine dinucleotide biosynthesis protein A